jgi:tripartite-type tricarboxylate transporter receptor subunit TctC
MLKSYFAACVFGVGLTGLGAGPALPQSYPSKPIRIITSPAGGGNDFPARLIARALTAPLGQQLIVDNRATVLIADLVDIFLKAGIEVAPGTPDELTAVMKSDVARTDKILKAAGVGIQ